MIDPNNENLLREAIEAFYFAYRNFTSGPDALLAERGLGRLHHRILYFVAKNPGISVGGLLDLLQVTKQAANRPLRTLEEQGLVTISPDEDDRRIRRIKTTKSGKELETELSGIQMDLLNTTFIKYGNHSLEEWIEIMRQLSAESKS